ncbi:hypothetical protein BX666DRAFT_1985507 [Dichotomocladium elegans]|nr:hypothetical protein BX666DRAFT_1985507 [Dichotomocladium elegans]
MTSSALDHTLLPAPDAFFIPNGSDKFDHHDALVSQREYINSTSASTSPISHCDDPVSSFNAHPSSILLDDEPYFCLSDYLAQSPGTLESQISLDEKEDHKNLITGATAPAPAVVTCAVTDNLQLRVIGAPDKSRVETQTRLRIQLLTANGIKVTHWPYLKLPVHLLARSRLKRAAQRPATDVADGNQSVLYLDANVICASQPDQPVKVCQGCIQRERKRAERSKNDNRARIDAAPEQDRILLFNCGPVVNFSSGDAILPTRIACYCRHHNEKVGFSVQFSVKDDRGNVIARGTSSPILITDDHKSSRHRKQKRNRTHLDRDIVSRPLREKHRLITPASSRRGSLSPPPRGAKQEIPTSSSLRNPFEERWHSSSLPSHTEELMVGSPLTPPPSVSPCISPDTLATSSPPLSFHGRQSSPQLERLIPAQGPTYGGVEVTVLGSGFYKGLTCVFGEHQATTVYWSPNTLVCILPPAAIQGPVVVSFKDHSLVLSGQGVPLFTYYNANEQALLELALQVVGLKMTGKLQNAKHIAMRIVQGGSCCDNNNINGSNKEFSGESSPFFSIG